MMLGHLLTFLSISLAINVAMFLVAFRRQTDTLTDVSYAATFVAVLFFGLIAHGVTLAKLLVAAMVIMWAARLGVFLLIRIRRSGKDVRFDTMRGNFWKFGRFWLTQGISVWIILLSVELQLISNDSVFTILSVFGFTIWLAGLGIEAVADLQKFRFTANTTNKGKWIDTGLWRYSRHPNYLGEIMVWSGIYLVTLPNLSPTFAFIALLSPLFIATLLLFVSGIPPLEKLADARWGANKNYRAYKKRTSVLLLWPPKQS